MSDLPRIGVMPTKLQKGMSNLDDRDVSLLDVQTFEETFTKNWQTDAQFVAYGTLDPAEQNTQGPWPRCTKPLLPKLRTQGVDLLLHSIVLDFDNPGHAAWTVAGLAGWLEKLFAMDWETAQNFTLLYTTRNGARLVYVLDQPIPVDKAESKHQWLCQQFVSHGLPVDCGVSDWTRVFRLPYVIRDGKPTINDTPPVEYIFLPENRLAAASLGEADPIKGKVNAYAADYVNSDLGEQPTPEDSRLLLEVESTVTGRLVYTDWQKTARTRLKGRECFPCIFEHQPLATQGSRDTMLLKYVGQAIGMLIRATETTPQHIYALFLDAVLQLDPDKDTPDWTARLWSMVTRIWHNEASQVAQEKAVEAVKEVETRTLAETIRKGAATWAKVPTDPVGGDDWVARHLIVSANSNFMVMSKDGLYESLQLSINQIIPRLRITGLDAIVTTREMKADGSGYRDVGANQIINAHATLVKDIEAKPQLAGGYIENLDTPDAVLVVPCFSRNEKLTPEYNPDVDAWLRQLFGEQYEIGCDWIRWALAFEEGPICALSLVGGQGIGKKLLAQGLAECLRTPRLADANDITGDCQYGLLESPFLVINEGWPLGHKHNHPADTFRALVSGDPIRVNRKYMAPVSLHNPVRVLLTGNNLELVRNLTAGRDLSPADREALAIRLLHIDAGDTASVWLRAKGGMKFTGARGSRWISGDGGEASDFVLARHFLWLHSQRGVPFPNGERFLIQGGNSEEIMWDMRTQTGSAPLVIETVIVILNQTKLPPGATIEDGRLYVLVSEVLNFFRQKAGNGEKLSANQITGTLKGLSVASRVVDRVLTSRKEMGVKRWVELDTKVLLEVGRRDGWNCKRLEDLAMQREAQAGLVEGAAPVTEGVTA
jgi:hypothetical protein